MFFFGLGFILLAIFSLFSFNAPGPTDDPTSASSTPRKTNLKTLNRVVTSSASPNRMRLDALTEMVRHAKEKPEDVSREASNILNSIRGNESQKWVASSIVDMLGQVSHRSAESILISEYEKVETANAKHHIIQVLGHPRHDNPETVSFLKGILMRPGSSETTKHIAKRALRKLNQQEPDSEFKTMGVARRDKATSKGE